GDRRSSGRLGHGLHFLAGRTTDALAGELVSHAQLLAAGTRKQNGHGTLSFKSWRTESWGRFGTCCWQVPNLPHPCCPAALKPRPHRRAPPTLPARSFIPATVASTSTSPFMET